MNIFKIRLKSMWHGFRLGIKKKLNISYKKNLINDYYYAQKTQNS
jgi:hypothetical protein